MNDDSGYVLAYGPAATAAVRAALHSSVRPHLHDVRAMLRLPLPELGITAGCNFAAAQVLLNVVAGLSRLLSPSPTNSGDAFREFIKLRYPWAEEPPDGLREGDGADALYDSFRNAFSHDLGLQLESVPIGPKRIRGQFRIGGEQLSVTKHPVSAVELDALDNVHVRPPSIGATVTRQGREAIVSVIPFYWGIRRLIYDHTSTPALVASLDGMIADTWKRLDDAGLVEHYSSEST